MKFEEVLAPMAMVREPERPRELMEEYLTVPELSTRIKFSRQSLYNLIHKRTFVLGKHFLKPSPKKILFKWSAIQSWMEDTGNSVTETASESALPKRDNNESPITTKVPPQSQIRI